MNVLVSQHSNAGSNGRNGFSLEICEKSRVQLQYVNAERWVTVLTAQSVANISLSATDRDRARSHVVQEVLWEN